MVALGASAAFLGHRQLGRGCPLTGDLAVCVRDDEGCDQFIRLIPSRDLPIGSVVSGAIRDDPHLPAWRACHLKPFDGPAAKHE